MISVLERFESKVAAGILARAALFLDDETNPAAQARLDGEYKIRQALLDEVRGRIGVKAEDSSPQAAEKLSDALDEELDSISGPTDATKVLNHLAAKGQIPSDLYEVNIIAAVEEFYQPKWYEERARILETVADADQEQHFGGAAGQADTVLVSLFAKAYPDKFPYRSFTMLVVGNRGDEMKLHVHQAWRLYADVIRLEGATDLVDLLRRFSEEFGLMMSVNGVETRFSLSAVLPKGGTERTIRVLPVYGSDSKGRRIEKDVDLFLSNFMTHGPDGSITAAMTNAIDRQKYLASIRSHGW